MLRFTPIKAVKALLTLLILVGCQTKQGVIERPEWAKEPVVWDYTGLTLSTYGVPPYKSNSQDMQRMAEESAGENLRRQLSHELAKAYIKATKASISEDDAARQLQNKIGNLLERQHSYDEQRHVYYIQIFIPASRVADLVNQTFNTKLKLQKNGSLGK